MALAIVSRSIPPRTGGSAFIVENLVSAFKVLDVVAIGEGAVFGHNAGTNPRYKHLRTALNFGGRGARFFSWFRALLFPMALVRTLLIFRERDVDSVLAVFPDGYYLALAYVASRLSNRSLSVYFHNTYLENRTGARRWWAERVQRAVFDHADRIFVMSDGMLDLYRDRYPSVAGKLRTLVHSFPEYPPPAPPPSTADGRPWRLAFTGNFNESNAESTARLVGALAGDPFEMVFYTPVPRALLRLRGIDTAAIDYAGYVSDADYYPSLHSNDAVVLTHGFSGGLSQEEYDTIFPTRVVPLLLSGRPLVAHVPAGSFIEQFLREHRCALVLTETDPDVLRARVSALLASPMDQAALLAAAADTVTMFHGPTVRETLLTELAASRRASTA